MYIPPPLLLTLLPTLLMLIVVRLNLNSSLIGKVLIIRSCLDGYLIREIPYFLSSHLPLESPLWAAPIGQDGIAIIANSNIELDSLTIEQLRAIYQGRITQWDEIIETGGEITIFSREHGSGIRAEFDRMVMGLRQTTSNARLVSSSMQMLASITQHPGSIGYVSLSHLDDSVQTLEIDGIPATQDNVYHNRYPLRSTVFVVGLVEPENEYRAFIGWMQSPEGQVIVAQKYAPLSGHAPD